VAGAATGTILAALFNYDHLGQFGEFFRIVPVHYELWAYAGVFGLLVVAGVLVRWILGSRYPKSKVMKVFRMRLFTMLETTGWLGLVMTLFVYERASYLAWRLWPVAVLVIGAVWSVWILTGPGKEVPSGLAAEAMQARKRKWLNFGRKSRS
jgi:hypothetical protein